MSGEEKEEKRGREEKGGKGERREGEGEEEEREGGREGAAQLEDRIKVLERTLREAAAHPDKKTGGERGEEGERVRERGEEGGSAWERARAHPWFSTGDPLPASVTRFPSSLLAQLTSATPVLNHGPAVQSPCSLSPSLPLPLVPEEDALPPPSKTFERERASLPPLDLDLPPSPSSQRAQDVRDRARASARAEKEEREKRERTLEGGRGEKEGEGEGEGEVRRLSGMTVAAILVRVRSAYARATGCPVLIERMVLSGA
eukprot:1166057-Rhodomonas_salina.2